MNNEEKDSKPQNAKKIENHNELERKRREQIKNGFTELQNTIPSVKNKQGTSCVEILRETKKEIESKENKIKSSRKNIEEMTRKIMEMKAEIQKLESLEEADGEDDLEFAIELPLQ